MNRRIELGCAWSCVVGVVLLLVGFWPIAALLPVPPADYSAANIATFYQDHTHRLRLGLLAITASRPIREGFELGISGGKLAQATGLSVL